LTDRLVENVRLVHLSREAVHKEPTLAIIPTLFSLIFVLFELVDDGILKKLDRDLTRHNLAFLDILADEITIF